MINYWLFIGLYIFAVFISSVSQILLKKSTKKPQTSLLKEYLNPVVLIAYGIFFLATFFTILAYKRIPLSLGPVLEASGYFFVLVLSRLVLKEKVAKKRVYGVILIIVGIGVFKFL